MSKIVYDYIEEYIRNLIPKEDDLLKELEEYALLNNVPIIHPEVAQLLSFLIKVNKPLKILEIGTAIGYSAIVMKKAALSGRIITIDRDSDMIKLAEENIKKAGFQDSIEIIEGDALDILTNMDKDFDFIFIDAAKGQYMEFFPHCHRMLNNEGIIFADNVLFRGMVATNELLIRRKITIVKRMRKYLKFITENHDYETSILPLGDGVAISLKSGGLANE
ncbi:putative O-methyltransferase [Oxobacter pfennigii]|uniref:tRNA 5-hydroxyuridine methyltransferase n=1 Tax=Oxobacter pfennigii TaxID=36849 RepID=A0A0P8WQW3_9CLOT|nr:O-methyltransferase [Oxobacter pfennigii]KPU44945.1 putative O-methyltransferase [Oxobacter pfennigii]